MRGTHTALAAVTLALGCAVEPPTTPQGDVNLGFFGCQVQPILDRSCAFVACHGDPGRPLFAYSTSKTRIAGAALLGEPLTDKELCANFYRARALVTADPAQSQLVTKPTILDGDFSQYHGGNYLFTPDGPEVSCLTAWMRGDSAPDGDSLPPEACRLPWRLDAAGNAPTCAPRRPDCEAALAGPDLPEVGS